MNFLQLIPAVAVEYLRRQLSQELEGTLRFCMVGLDKAIVSGIASAVAQSPELQAIEVHIPPSLALPSIDPALVSSEAAAHWRHTPPRQVGKRAILFAVDNAELERIGNTVSALSRIDTALLRSLTDEWFTVTGLKQRLGAKELERLQNVLMAVDRGSLARTITMFASFVGRIGEQVEQGSCKSVEEAVDRALPALHIPRSGSGFALTGKKNETLSPAAIEKALLAKREETKPFLAKQTEKGEALDPAKLVQNLKQLWDKGEIDEATGKTIFAFIDDKAVTPDSWRPSQDAIAELDWRVVQRVFDGFEPQVKRTLGSETIDYFNDELPGILSEEDVKLLESIKSSSKPTAPVLQFFQSHQAEIAQCRDSKAYRNLATKWEKFIYSAPEEYSEFLEGLVATMHRVIERAEQMPERSVFLLDLPGSEAKSFWSEKHNAKLGRYFQFRYHGLERLFGDTVLFRLGRMQSHPLEEYPEGSSAKSASALQFKFEVRIIDRALADDINARRQAPTAQFIWTLPPQSVALSLPDDLKALATSHPILLTSAKVTRESVNSKGEIQRIRLEDSTTLRDAYGNSDGRLIDPNLEDHFQKQIPEALERLRTMGVLDGTQATELDHAFRRFQDAYGTAIRDWVDPAGTGISSPAFLEQAAAFGSLLTLLRTKAYRDQCRFELWRKLLTIGIAHITTGGRAAIVTPWHPLRLAEIAIKARQVADLAARVCRADLNQLDGADLFFSQVRRNVTRTYYSEVCIDHADERITLLSLMARHADYSLMEVPTRTIGGNPLEDVEALDADAAVAAEQFARVSEQFLELQPHQRSNFSAVLYNAESKELPAVLADELGNRVERDADLRCDLLLTHDNPTMMRQMYEQQNAAAGDGAESLLANETARSFLSRLRVGLISADGFPRVEHRAATDIVFLQDVVARSAQLDWVQAPDVGELPDIQTFVPTQWSRRKPIARGDQNAAVYLVAPLQPGVGQSYLNLIHDLITGAQPDSSHWLPVRRVAFNHSAIGQVLDRAHEIGEWVACYDALADRRLLENRGISIIRHVNDRENNRGLIVSTRHRPKLLLTVLEQRLEGIFPNSDKPTRLALGEEFVNQALRLSGKIVMRAARYGHFAGELLGVVLSMGEVRKHLQAENDRHIGWFFLDDYATWFGQPEEQIADILALAPVEEDGRPILKVIVAESKFVNADGVYQAEKKSASQLLETAMRIGRALDPECDRIDRQVWLERLADLMIEGMEPFDEAPIFNWDLHTWSHQVRTGKVPIRFMGLSHVFVHEPDLSIETKRQEIGAAGPCVQEVFGFEATRALIEHVGKKHAIVPQGQPSPIWEIALEWTPLGESIRPASEWGESMKLATNAPILVDDAPLSPVASEDPLTVQGEQEAPQPDTKLSEVVTIAEQPDVTQVAAMPEAVVTEPQAPAIEVVKGAATGAFPPLVTHWLEAGGTVSADDTDRLWLQETQVRLQRALRNYEMSSEVTGFRLTPNAAIFRFRGSDSLTVSKVEKRQQELKTSHAIDVLNVLPGLGEVIIMVRRPHRVILSLRELWSRRQLLPTAPDSNLSLLLGAKEADGELLHLNIGEPLAGGIQHGPHTLIAGETGSGKGVLVQCLLLDILATNSPTAAKIRMIDPKAGVDFPWLRKMPHLQGGLVTNQEEAISTLEELVAEMERRYSLFAALGVAKLSQYNRNLPPEQRLPVIWLFHDELADWMLIDEYRQAVETNVTRLGVKARAAGIHLVFITQRPDKDALPVQLRANMSNRLVLKVGDRRNSELALDEPGAERLLGKGHLAAKLSGEGNVILAQVPFISEDEIHELAHAIMESWLSAAEVS